MFVAPGTKPTFGYKLSRDAAQRIASNWWLLLLNGALLIVAGVLIFSIDWTIRSLATFIGVVFIVQGVAEALTAGIDTRVRRANVVTGLLSIATGIVIIVWPGVLALADPAATLAALITVAGIWTVAIGVARIALAFEIKRLPDDVDKAFAAPNNDQASQAANPKRPPLAATST
jgi:uncharacterized membrane protein HdeD (DUF308 family)